MLQQADVVAHLVGALADGRQAVQDEAVELSRIGLPADVEALVEAEFRGDLAVHLVDLFLIAFKQLHKAGLGTGRAAGPEELHLIDDEVELHQVAVEILQPQAGALAHGHRLRRLVVRVAQTGHILIFQTEFREGPHGRFQFFS